MRINEQLIAEIENSATCGLKQLEEDFLENFPPARKFVEALKELAELSIDLLKSWNQDTLGTPKDLKTFSESQSLCNKMEVILNALLIETNKAINDDELSQKIQLLNMVMEQAFSQNRELCSIEKLQNYYDNLDWVSMNSATQALAELKNADVDNIISTTEAALDISKEALN